MLQALFANVVEAANLRFMPEAICWLFYQLRFGENQPDPALVASAAPPPGLEHEAGFFQTSCIKPLYRLVKAAAAKKEVVDNSCGPYVMTAGGLCGRAPKRYVANSERVNYDDANEFFWDPACLEKAWYAEDADNGPQTIVFVKTFFEKAGYIAILLSFWR